MYTFRSPSEGLHGTVNVNISLAERIFEGRRGHGMAHLKFWRDCSLLIVLQKVPSEGS